MQDPWDENRGGRLQVQYQRKTRQEISVLFKGSKNQSAS